MSGANRYAACRHCGLVRSLQARRLCQRCYGTPQIRPLYPAQGQARGKRRVLGLAVVAPSKPAAEPTQTEPGSEERITVMRERLKRGEHLRHPEDRE